VVETPRRSADVAQAERVGLAVSWEDLWEQPLERVRATYGIRPLDRAWFAAA
jgi:ubiquinone biosynthesis protein Coq4